MGEITEDDVDRRDTAERVLEAVKNAVQASKSRHGRQTYTFNSAAPGEVQSSFETKSSQKESSQKGHEKDSSQNGHEKESSQKGHEKESSEKGHTEDSAPPILRRGHPEKPARRNTVQAD